MTDPFEIRFEWEEPDAGVRHAALAATWARLEIHVEGHCVTECVDGRAYSRRRGVYGALAPLAAWIADNYWFLLSESQRVLRVLSARGPEVRSDRGWFRRHGWLVAREGFALPDFVMCRDDARRVRVAWTRDPDEGARFPVRFIGQGSAWVSTDDVRRELERLVDSVLARCEDVSDPSIDEIRERWAWARGLDQRERRIASRAAALGLDAFEADEVPDRLRVALAEGLDAFGPELRSDLLSATTPESVELASSRVGSALASAAEGSGGIAPGVRERWLSIPRGDERTSYQRGWSLAAVFREQVLGIGPSVIGAALDRHMTAQGVAWDSLARPLADFGDRSLRGLVASTQRGETVLLTPNRSVVALRFMKARALFCAVESPHARLLTDARTADQSTGRAFATELLAPTEEVARRVGPTVDDDEIASIARDMAVSPSVIRHQIENHSLSQIIDG